MTFAFTDFYSRWSSQVVDKHDLGIVLEPCLPYHGIDYGQKLDLLSQIQTLETADDFVAFGRTALAFKRMSIAFIVILSIVAVDFLSLFDISDGMMLIIVLGLTQNDRHSRWIA